MRRLHEISNGEVLTKASATSSYTARVCANFRLFDRIHCQNERTNQRKWVCHQKKIITFWSCRRPPAPLNCRI
jgi:hypothetical protein